MQQINLLEVPDIKYVHFIGIGGISMSGLAEILLSLGYRVSGSDMKASSITDRLHSLGMDIYIGHSGDNIKSPDLVVYTAAVKEDNPELIAARALGVPVIDRAALLGQVMKRYPFSIAISGTHGKTTTTSMITMIMLEAGSDPTVHIGGELKAIGGNTLIGGSRYFVTEACEYVESFLKFYPHLAVILNIDADHLDYFRDIDHIKQAFLKFASLVPNDGFVVACADDTNTMEVVEQLSCNKITYGIASETAMWRASDISFNQDGCASFKLIHENDRPVEVELGVTGIHNVGNALAAIAACKAMGCDMPSIIKGLSKFSGTHRRFELKGFVNGVKVIDDYAHHPSEVKATLKAARNSKHSKLWCVFQPHTYTRTKALLGEFSEAFTDADKIILSDIYAAREADKGEIHSKDLAARLIANGQDTVYIKSFDAIVEHLSKNVSPDDLVITMGAGDIYRVGEMFIQKFS